MRLIPRFKHLLRPDYYLGKRTTKRTNRVVQAGPFQGMRYIGRAFGSVYFPKLLGIYEREIYPYIDRVIPEGHDLLVDIGVAEGYFAVGLALKQPAPVVGFEPGADGFFWLAGQGGYGYQTAPALSQTAACLVLRDPLPAAVAAAGVSAVDLSVERFR